jgi:hypothetical protein
MTTTQFESLMADLARAGDYESIYRAAELAETSSELQKSLLIKTKLYALCRMEKYAQAGILLDASERDFKDSALGKAYKGLILARGKETQLANNFIDAVLSTSAPLEDNDLEARAIAHSTKGYINLVEGNSAAATLSLHKAQQLWNQLGNKVESGHIDINLAILATENNKTALEINPEQHTREDIVAIFRECMQRFEKLTSEEAPAGVRNKALLNLSFLALDLYERDSKPELLMEAQDYLKQCGSYYGMSVDGKKGPFSRNRGKDSSDYLNLLGDIMEKQLHAAIESQNSASANHFWDMACKAYLESARVAEENGSQRGRTIALLNYYLLGNHHGQVTELIKDTTEHYPKLGKILIDHKVNVFEKDTSLQQWLKTKDAHTMGNTDLPGFQ